MADTFTVKDSENKTLADKAASPVTVSGLTANTECSGWTATKNDGTDALNLSDQYTLPSKPTVTAVPDDGAIKIVVAKKNGDGAAPITKAVVQYKTGSGDWTDADVDLKTLTANITGLTNGTEYSFQAQIGNAGGDSKMSDPITATPDPATIAVESVALDQTTLSGKVGDKVKLVATVKPDNATDKTVGWTTTDPKIAAVATDGTVTFIAAGTATITAKAGDKSATSAVTVAAADVAVTGVTVDPTTVSVAVGATAKITTKVAPDNATDKTVALSSADETIAKVAADGTITGVKEGTTKVTAKAGDKTADVAVTVTKAASVKANNNR